MKPFELHTSVPHSVDIDALLQDSYLLVVELRQGASTRSSKALWNLCVQHVDQVRQALEASGMSQRSIQRISHAQCALLDESVFTFANQDARDQWAGEPLQAKFFNRHQAGEFLYEEMRDVLREPMPDPCVVTVYQRVMLLGFRGRYHDLDAPERTQLIAELEARVPPLQFDNVPMTQLVAGRLRSPSRVLRSPVLHGLIAAALLVSVWMWLDRYLAGLITAFASGSV